MSAHRDSGVCVVATRPERQVRRAPGGIRVVTAGLCLRIALPRLLVRAIPVAMPMGQMVGIAVALSFVFVHATRAMQRRVHKQRRAVESALRQGVVQ